MEPVDVGQPAIRFTGEYLTAAEGKTEARTSGPQVGGQGSQEHDEAPEAEGHGGTAPRGRVAGPLILGLALSGPQPDDDQRGQHGHRRAQVQDDHG